MLLKVHKKLCLQKCKEEIRADFFQKIPRVFVALLNSFNTDDLQTGSYITNP